MAGLKEINAGDLIQSVLEIAETKNISLRDLDTDDKDEILLSLGFPPSNVNLKVKW